MTRTNLIFIMSDDHAAHAISAYGSLVNKTPHLDRIAQNGVRMDAPVLSCDTTATVGLPYRGGFIRAGSRLRSSR